MEKIENEKILIDTNVLVYCGDKGWGEGAKKILRILKDNGNKLAIYEASCFELIKNAIDDTYRKYYFSLINYIDRKPIKREHLQNGAYLYHAYYKYFNGNCKKIGSIDLMISGLVIYEKGALLLTSNRKDFPMPFWKLVKQCHILRKIGENDEILNVFLLKFDYDSI